VTGGEPLFREEARRNRGDKLLGDISLAMPLSWQVIGFTMLAILVAAFLFLALASYSRVEMASGAIVLDRGVVTVVPPRRGSIAEIAVRDGQRVRAGDPLLRIRSEEDLARGSTIPRQIEAAMAEQDARVAAQAAETGFASVEGQARLAAQIEGIRQELVSLDSQIRSQRRLIEVSDGEFREVEGIAKSGFISRRDLNAREASLVERRQQLAQLEQGRASKRAEMAQLQRGMAQADAQARAQAAALQSTRAALAEHRAEAEAADSYVLASPVDGTVTAVTARPGSAAAVDQPLMAVIPDNSRPQALFHVPSHAAGFLAPGQEVRIAVDAFPSQRFGTVPARIVRISSTAIPRATPQGETIAVFLVTAELERPFVNAFGQRRALLPGMTLSARIVVERQSLLEWLFAPLFAAASA
jgi:membrane fusion protein